MPPRQKSCAAPDLLDADVSFPLQRLFDTHNMDHIPQEQRLDPFMKRDLGHIKSYKAAVKIFGGPLSRKRVIVAPPMETPIKHRLGVYLNKTSAPEAPCMNSTLKAQDPPTKEPSAEELAAQQEEDKAKNYQTWIAERKQLRQDLNGIGLNEQWLKGKNEKTDLESRVFTRIKAEKGKKVEEPRVIEPPPPLKQPPPVPTMKIPSPTGLQILDQHLAQKRIRLLDLFRLVDKDKNWAVSKDEFARCIKEAELDISPKELEDLIISLDGDLNEEVDYAELAQGMEVWKRERRDLKRQSLSSSSSPHSRSPSPVTSRGDRSQSSSSKSSQRQTMYNDLTRTNRLIEQMRVKESRPLSNSSASDKSKGSSTPRHLEPPPSDVRLEQMILSSDEAMIDLRKHDQVVLARSSAKRKSSGKKRERTPSKEGLSVIETGYKAIDNHSKGSTLGGEVGQMVDKFRQMRLKEYYDVVRMCEEKGVPLTPHLLDRVLLYPPDHHSAGIKRKVSQPGTTLLSVSFAASPKPARQPLEVRHKDKMKRSKSGQLMIDSRHVYPSSASVAPSISKEVLSTGRALISRRVDCWMSFEEYDQLTGHLAVRYKQLHGNVDSNAFWPGHLLNKLRLFMPDNPDRSQALFYNTRQPRRANPAYTKDIQT